MKNIELIMRCIARSAGVLCSPPVEEVTVLVKTLDEGFVAWVEAMGLVAEIGSVEARTIQDAVVGLAAKVRKEIVKERDEKLRRAQEIYADALSNLAGIGGSDS